MNERADGNRYYLFGARGRCAKVVLGELAGSAVPDEYFFGLLEQQAAIQQRRRALFVPAA